MTRPTVQIERPGTLDALRAHLAEQLPLLIGHEGLVGALLSGGLARGFADELSEIDVTLYLETGAYLRWNRGHAPYATGIVRRGGRLYDLRPVDLAAERERDWAQADLWDAACAEVLHDPSGAVAALLAEKLVPPDPAQAGGPLFSAWWHYRLAGDVWIGRGDSLQGHHVLNQAVSELVSALFLGNGQYVPPVKWLIHMSRSLAWTPVDWPDRLAAAMTVRPTPAALQARQAVIDGLWAEIDAHLMREHAPGRPLTLMQQNHYDLLLKLVRQGGMAAAEWDAAADPALLSQEPFASLVTIAGGRIRLDRARLLAAGPDDMYAWHYEVLDAARSRVGRPDARHHHHAPLLEDLS